ncbi:MAG TPA: glycosyltransferase family 39 protein [Thermomonospora sp.]|nr:glycosyltransferase family 39 protein [Thermomonospora sp.]
MSHPEGAIREGNGARWAVPAVPAAVALAVNLWGLSAASPWRDEAATLSAARRPLGELVRLLAHIDAVHGLYYLFMHGWTALFGTGVAVVRLPSVVAVAVTAGVTAVLGRRLADDRTGMTAGLLVALSPVLSRYGQETRQYAVAAAVAAVSTLLLVRALERGDRRSFALYGASVALVGWVHLFTLLLLPVHAVALWGVRHDRAVPSRWGLSAAGGLAAVLPLALVALPQRSRQVEWIPSPTLDQVRTLYDAMAGDRVLVGPVVVLGAMAFWRRFGRGPVELRTLAVAWAMLPPALLLGISLVEPSYVLRYVVFCVPGVALLTAAGLRSVPFRAVPAVVLVMAALTVPMHLSVRQQDSRPDDLRRLAHLIRERREPGDAVVFAHRYYRRVTAADPGAFRGLRDVTSREPAGRIGDLQDSEVTDEATLWRRLAGVDRIWWIANSTKTPPAPESTLKERVIVRSGVFRRVRTLRFKGGRLILYVRR